MGVGRLERRIKTMRVMRTETLEGESEGEPVGSGGVQSGS